MQSRAWSSIFIQHTYYKNELWNSFKHIQKMQILAMVILASPQSVDCVFICIVGLCVRTYLHLLKRKVVTLTNLSSLPAPAAVTMTTPLYPVMNVSMFAVRCIEFGDPICLYSDCDCLNIEAETKWPSFSRRHFQTHFLEWKCMSFD